MTRNSRHRTWFPQKSIGISLASTLILFLLPMKVAEAAPSIASVQAQITALQIQATSIAESAQQSQVDLINLTRSLSSIQARDVVQTSTLNTLKKSMGIIAVEQYKNGALGQGMSLIFSSNPTQYLNSAQSLNVVEEQNAVKLRKYATVEIQLKSTAITLKQQVALVAAAKAKYAAEEIAAQAKLKEAQAILTHLTKAQRARLVALQATQDKKYQSNSLALIRKGVSASGAPGVALKFAMRQLGSRYMFGAAGMIFWDCSGLTMKALAAAGISVPHSAAAQSQYGKYVPLSQARPGDLLFFGQPISHVGIYFGNGKMLHAPHSGARVRIDSFGPQFGSKRLVAVRRF
jgi:peptidoglycan DL-endopeptidase CwlO